METIIDMFLRLEPEEKVFLVCILLSFVSYDGYTVVRRKGRIQ